MGTRISAEKYATSSDVNGIITIFNFKLHNLRCLCLTSNDIYRLAHNIDKNICLDQKRMNPQ